MKLHFALLQRAYRVIGLALIPFGKTSASRY
jgi:hypothetical protein